MKKKIISTIIYAVNLLLLSSPWITIGECGYNVFQFARMLMTDGLGKIANDAGLAEMDLTLFEFGVSVQVAALMFFSLFSVLYIVFTWRGKGDKIHFISIVLAMVVIVPEFSMSGFCFFCQNPLVTGLAMFAFLSLTLLEWPISMLLEHWDEAMIEAREYEIQDKAWKQEVKERLSFQGKYSPVFYRVVWKNFKRNWRDYVLLLVCSAVIFAFMIMGFGMQQVLAIENNNKGIGNFSGLNTILVNAMIPMGIVSVFIIILLIFYYLKCRAANYGVFLTLGMRRKTLYYFMALEFISGLLAALILGAVFGTGCLLILMNCLERLLDMEVGLSVVGFYPYLKAAGIIVLICIVSLMAARDIFIDFNVGKSTDLRAIGERLPGRFRRMMLIVGVIICSFSIIQYGKIYSHENVTLLLGLFVGTFFIFRYGMAEMLLRERKNESYLKKLLLHNQLYHKSMTNAGYITAFTIVHFCVLFYFTFQILSIVIAEDADTLYPYDIVCLAQENDQEFLEEISEKYEIEMQEYPMVRVSAYDSTEEFDYTPPQGQHIGISEATYHELKKRIDPAYKKKTLNLDAGGENIFIVHQQDKSVKAQPIEFYSFLHEPLLHIGQPIRAVDIYGVGRGKDVGYKFYEIAGEESGSLIGAFRQGLRENIIVFSDEYFNEIQDKWKTTHIYYGEPIENEVERIEGFNINQGITRLVLINILEEDTGNLLQDMKEFEDRHLEEEASIYTWPQLNGVYDFSVSYHYEKDEAVKNLQTERIMKITMNALVIALFLIMNILLIAIKVLSEREQDKKRADFLACMGMREKDIRLLLGKELLRYYHFLPLISAALFALFFTVVTFHVRMYTSMDIQNYLCYMIPLWLGYIFATTIIVTCISRSNIYHLRSF